MRAAVLLVALLAAAPARAQPAPASSPSAEPPATNSTVTKPDATRPEATKSDATKPDAVAATDATLCGALEAAANRNDLPVAFFTRLIWQESRFDPAARSPVGAQGVAQFMPATAAGRGLVDPFEPARALDESAAYLRELRAQFGNLGLAAAGYNAGPGRLARWIAGGTDLPGETIAYVRTVTGHSVGEWREPVPPALAPEPGFSCLRFAGEAGRRAAPASAIAAPTPGAPAPKPWSVILVGALSRAAVLREYDMVRASHSAVLGALTPSFVRRRIGGAAIPRFVAQIEQEDRASSNRLCQRLHSSGGSCIVLRNAGR